METALQKEIAFSNRDLRRLIIPLFIEQLLNCTVGLIDSLMVATVGEAAVSAVSLVDSISILLVQAFGALAAGGAIVAGQYIGCREMKRACRAGQQLTLSMGLTSVVVMALLYLFSNFLINVVFGAITAEVEGYARTYFYIVSASIPFMAIYCSGAALFRMMGNSRISMVIAIAMNAINVAGNALLLFVFDMGIAGVAIATLFSRIVAAIVAMALLCNEKHEIHFPKGGSWKPDWNMIRNIMSLGIPNGLESSLFQLGKIVMLSLISGFGTAAIAANAITNNMATYQIIGGHSVGLAMVTVVSQYVGAGKYDEVRRYTKRLMKLSYLLVLVMVSITLVLFPLILYLYDVSDEANYYAIQCVLFHSAAACFLWPASFTLPHALRAAGDAKYTMFVSIASMWIVRVGFGYLLGGYFGMGVFGVWVAMILDWCCRIPLLYLRYRSNRWQQMLLIR